MIDIYHHGKLVEQRADDTAGRVHVAKLVGHGRLRWRPHTDDLRAVWSKGQKKDEAEWLATRPAVTARVMQYGLPFAPSQNRRFVEDQIYHAHQYRNVLIEIERERRAMHRTVLWEHPTVKPAKTDLDRLIAAVTEARDAIKQARAKTRSRSETKPMRERVDALVAERKTAREAFKKAVKTAKKDIAVKDALKKCNEHAHARVLEAREQCKAHWGTYTLVEEAQAQSLKALKSLDPDDDPKFRRFQKEGFVSVQAQNGVSVAKALACTHTQIQIDPVSEAAWSSPRRGERRKAARTKVRLRLGTDSNNQPIWAEWSMIFHRPFPENGVIKRVTVTKRQRDCRHWRWQINFTVELQTAQVQRRCGEGVVAVNFGWRQVKNQRLRVMYWRDEFGQAGEELLDESIIPRLEQVEGLRSLRDQKLDSLREDLVQWLADNADRLPEWLQERTKNLSRSKSARRFRAIALMWRENRFEGDEDIYRRFASNVRADESWVYRDEHLETWESNQRGTTLRHRREQYRRKAAEFASTYGELLIDDTDYRKMQRSPSPESDDVEIEAVKLAKNRAAPSEFRRILTDAFKSRRGSVIIYDVAKLKPTMTCHVCQSEEDWDRAAYLHHTCSQCKTTWDQDDNYCRNLLRERLGNDGSTAPTRGNDPDAVEPQSVSAETASSL